MLGDDSTVIVVFICRGDGSLKYAGFFGSSSLSKKFLDPPISSQVRFQALHETPIPLFIHKFVCEL